MRLIRDLRRTCFALDYNLGAAQMALSVIMELGMETCMQMYCYSLYFIAYITLHSMYAGTYAWVCDHHEPCYALWFDCTMLRFAQDEVFWHHEIYSFHRCKFDFDASHFEMAEVIQNHKYCHSFGYAGFHLPNAEVYRRHEQKLEHNSHLTRRFWGMYVLFISLQLIIDYVNFPVCGKKHLHKGIY